MTNSKIGDQLRLKLSFIVVALIAMILFMVAVPSAATFIFVNIIGVFLFAFMVIAILKG